MNRPLLSVNINKYALLRNARGHNAPDVLWAVDECIAAGAHGITVHPRLDQRHTRRDDVPAIANHLREHHVHIEYNIECEPDPGLIDLVLEIRPAQCTLVPVGPGEVTSDHGWDLPKENDLLIPVIARLKDAGIRVSIFMDCDPELVARARNTGTNRVEIYTGPYAWAWGTADQERERERMFAVAEAAQVAGLGLNAGHDLDRHNLLGLRGLPGLQEVSIGHAQICRALEVGTRQSVEELLTALGY
ncbi:MAG: pyridoxine 5'-phosphate synthase [Deltaproteobacteria bacterium]|nr:pyridoxine 5'-phosphate synthase [Deltaproteobacteria bacterium]